MDLEEALQVIRSSGHRACLVVWSRNEIVAVREASAPFDEADGLCVGRFVDPTTVSLETLRAQQEETRLDELETVERARARQAWQDAPIGELLDLLEAEKGVRDAGFILDTLYYARSATLRPAHIERLNVVADDQSFRLGWMAAARLEGYLTVLEGRPSRFFRYWDSLRLKGSRTVRFEIMTAAGDLQIDRADVLKYLVGHVAQGIMFQPRFDSMLALGKIGPRAGEAAAAAIEQHIYESSDLVASIRRLAIARIRSTSDDWIRCDTCVRGWVLDTAHRVPYFAQCSRCFGLAHVSSREQAL